MDEKKIHLIMEVESMEKSTFPEVSIEFGIESF